LIYRPKENLKFKFFEKPPINAWGFFLFIPDLPFAHNFFLFLSFTPYALCIKLKALYFPASRITPYALSSKTIPHFSELFISEIKKRDFLPLPTSF